MRDYGVSKEEADKLIAYGIGYQDAQSSTDSFDAVRGNPQLADAYAQGFQDGAPRRLTPGPPPGLLPLRARLESPSSF